MTLSIDDLNRAALLGLLKPDEIVAFQSNPKHHDHIGLKLKPDGVLGAKTRWALSFETLCPERRALIRTGHAFAHVVEVPLGSNSDPEGWILRWLERCPGCKPHDPYCAAFVSWVISQSLTKVAIGGALALGRHFPETDDPVCGDIFTIPTNDKGAGHTGFVLGTGSTQIMTWEANSSDRVGCWLRDRVPTMRFHRVVQNETGRAPGCVPSMPTAGQRTR
ncbi:MAG: CHAP domain-containing protein [Polyangiaceae bacterium]